jgi:hypothetical protein
LRFTLDAELELFAESVRGVLSGWASPVEEAVGDWADERDGTLARRLAELGWAELWSDPELLGPAVAGGLELGRAIAPLHVLDEAALGAPLGVGSRVRHGEGVARAAVAVHGGLALIELGATTREPALDCVGTVVVALGPAEPMSDAQARLRVWSAATAAYLAGLADAALSRSVEHARQREQFGAPLAALPAVQAKLADAALLADGARLVAWSLADPDGSAVPVEALTWTGAACRDVSAVAQQVHGAIGFALESGLHRVYRRAKTVQVWTEAGCRALSL